MCDRIYLTARFLPPLERIVINRNRHAYHFPLLLSLVPSAVGVEKPRWKQGEKMENEKKKETCLIVSGLRTYILRAKR